MDAGGTDTGLLACIAMGLTTSTAFYDVEVIFEVRHSMGVNARYFPCAVAFFLRPPRRPTVRPSKTASTKEVTPSSDLGEEDLGETSPSHHPNNVQVSF